MKRLQRAELEQLLACPECAAVVRNVEHGFECSGCQKLFGFFRERPVLISEANELFPASAYIQSEAADNQRTNKPSTLQKLKRLIPKQSINLAREQMFQRLAVEHSSKKRTILVVGCGNQTGQLEHYFPDESSTFVFCDIDQQADADLFCDSHDLAFQDGVFDGVISTAVLEHVLYPEKVISEIHRVLKKGGFIYSEIPFLQSVHEGAYDFTRFTMSGHRRLLERFEEIDTGMVAGPGTALVWSLVSFFKGLSTNRRMSSLLSIAARTGFFWLKYFDYLMKDNPAALDAASCTYFYGSKRAEKVTATEIVRRYSGGEFKHL